MIFCTSDTPYPHKVRTKYAGRKGVEELWKCPDCGETYILTTDQMAGTEKASGAEETPQTQKNTNATRNSSQLRLL